MKRFIPFLIVSVFWSCGVDELQDRIDGLDTRLAALEEQVASLNEEVSDLQALVSGKRFISGVSDNGDGSWTLTLVTAAGEQSEITVKDGEDGYSPQIGVKEDGGVMYWTLDGEFVLDGDGGRLPVSGNDGITPEFKIEDGYWYVSYGDGWQECGKAQADAGPALFKSVSLSEDGKLVYLTMQDDTVLTFEMYAQFGIEFDSADKFVESGASVSVPFTLTGADENAVVEALAEGGWAADVKLDKETLSGTIEITAPAETSTGKVIVLANDGGYKTLMRTLTFISGVLNVSTSSVEAPSSGGTVSVEVETDMDFEVSIPEAAADWISAVETRSEVRTETVTLQVAANSAGTPRQAEVALVSGGVTVETVIVFQMADYDPALFVLEAQARELTGSAASYSMKVYLPLYGDVDVTVDWGDGSSEEVKKTVSTAAALVQHTYTETGTYYITVNGSAGALKGTSINKNAAPAVTRILQWGRLGVTSLEDAFKNNTSITSVPSPEEGAFAAVTTADGMFDGCSSLKTVPGDLLASAAGLTDVGSIFNGCSSLESVPVELFASNPLITDASVLLTGCSSLTEIPEDLLSKQTEITSLASALKGCSSLKSIPENLFASQTKVANLSSLFTDCTSLESVPSGLFRNQASVTNIATMFKGCSSLVSVPEGFLDVFTKVTNINSLFSGCSSLAGLPAGIFRNLSAVTTASYLYEGCKELMEFPSIKTMASLKTVPGMWKDCSNITGVPADYFPESVSGGTSAAYMFQNCTSLKNVPEGLFDDFSSVTTISQMFQNCTSLESLPACIFDSMTKVRTAANVFNGCSAFTGESPYTEVNGQKIHLYERSAENGFTEVTSYKDCFTGCEKMADYAYIPIAWGGISDGTKGLPELEISMTPSSGAEYYMFDISIKGTDVKTCKYVLGETATVEARTEELGGYDKLCNRYGSSFADSVIDNINSDQGHSVSSSEIEAGTEYTLVVMAGNVHGTTIETVKASTAEVPAGEADYQRYIGTWTVTSASSEITGQPQTFTVEIEPYRVNESFRVSGWGITTMGDKDTAPFIMDYSGGDVSIRTYDYCGMVGMYYVYLKYRFRDNGAYYVWTTEDALATGSYGSDGTVTIDMGKFTNPADGVEHQVIGMDYFLYSGGKYYEAQDMFKEGYTMSDYSIGPYRLTRAGASASAAAAGRLKADSFVNIPVGTSHVSASAPRHGAAEVIK